MRKPLQFIAHYCYEKGKAETDRIVGQRGKVLALYEPAFESLPGQEAFPDPPELPAQDASLRLFSYLDQMFSILSETQPVMLILDDLQWTDDLTLDWLTFMTRTETFNEFPIIFLGTTRLEELNRQVQHLCSHPGTCTYTVDKLLEEDIREMVQEMLALPTAPAIFSRFLTRHSAGNPFFVAEYMRTAVDEGVLWRDDQGYWQVSGPEKQFTRAADYESLPLPRSLRELLIRRLTDLTPDALKIIYSAAVLGLESNITLLKEMVGGEEASFYDAIADVKRRRLLDEGEEDTLRFVHNKLREVTYQTINAGERRRLHSQAVEMIERTQAHDLSLYYARLAHHCQYAEEQEKECFYARLAGKQALFKYSNADALKYLRRALELTPPHKQAGRYEILLDLEQILDLLGEREEQTAIIGALSDLAQLLDDNFRRAEVALRQANLAEVKGDYATTIAEAQKVISVAVADHPRAPHSEIVYLQIKALIQWGRALFYRDDYASAQDLYTEALALAREHGFFLLEALCLRNSGNAAAQPGDYFEAEKTYVKSLALSRKIGDQQGEAGTLNNLGLVAKFAGNLVQAKEYFLKSLSLYREMGYRRGECLPLSNLGDLAFIKNDCAHAQKYYEQTLLTYRETSDPGGECRILSKLGNVQRDQHHYEEAITYFQQVIDLSRKIGSLKSLSTSLCQWGIALWLKGDYSRAEELLNESLQICQQIGDRLNEGTVLSNLGPLMIYVGNFVKARAHFEQ
ncbi:tetratricopeptide repeat protein, partial [candidate division CSSED10-310 bacterium]